MDWVIHVDPAGIRRIVSELPKDEYYVDVGGALQALRRHSQFNVIDRATGWKSDLIVGKQRPFSKAEFERRQTVEIEGDEPMSERRETHAGKSQISG